MRHLLPALLLSCLTLAAAPAMACAPVDGQQALADSFHRWVNILRAERGLGPLRMSGALDRAALLHACDMAKTGKFAHRGSAGSTLKTRLASAGYDYNVANENLAWSQLPMDAAATGRMWYESPGHKANLLQPGITEMGIAATRGPSGYYYVFVGGRS